MDADVALVAEAGGTERAGPIPRDALRDQRLQALDIQRRHIPRRHEEQLEPDGRRACGESPAGPVDFGAACSSTVARATTGPPASQPTKRRNVA